MISTRIGYHLSWVLKLAKMRYGTDTETEGLTQLLYEADPEAIHEILKEAVRRTLVDKAYVPEDDNRAKPIDPDIVAWVERDV